MSSFYTILYYTIRVLEWRLCKIFVSCVKFSRKQRSFFHILQVYTHINVKNLHILFNFNQKKAQFLIMMHFCCLLLAKIVSIYAFSVCKILSPKNWFVLIFGPIPSLPLAPTLLWIFFYKSTQSSWQVF